MTVWCSIKIIAISISILSFFKKFCFIFSPIKGALDVVCIWFSIHVPRFTGSFHAPLCLECTARPDSPHHQLFECPNFQSESRSHLCASIGNLETNFHLPIIFHTNTNGISNLNVMEDGTILSTCTLCEARKAFKDKVKHVCEQSQFQYELLSR